MAQAYCFVSILGTQIMGTLQPYMAFAEEYGQTVAWLLYTMGKFSTKDKADAAKEFIEENDLGLCEVFPVSLRIDGPESATVVVTRLAEEAKKAGERICFNVDGGMNYLIAACALALKPYKPLYIAASEERIVVYDSQDDSYRALPLPRMLGIEEMLKLQGVNYKKNSPCGFLFQPTR